MTADPRPKTPPAADAGDERIDPFHALQPGHRVGKYTITKVIGRGRSAFVYDATDSSTGRRVALKILHPTVGPMEGSRVSDERWFRREARMLSMLSHPNIVELYEADRFGDRWYLAMEYVEGRTFSELYNDGILDLRASMIILRDAARAMAHAHEKGVIHRDIKPQNIVIDSRGRCRVTDFGTAKGVSVKQHATLTQKGFVVGTPTYMSPEQAMGRRDLDEQTDVYSLGAILYSIIAGAPPFRGESPSQTLLKIVTDPLVSPSVRARETGMPQVDPVLEDIAMRALNRDRVERTPTAGLLADKLTQWIEGSNGGKAGS